MELKINSRNAKDSNVDMKSDTLPIPRTDAKKNLPEGWVWKKVSDLGEVLTGTTPTKAKKEYYDSKDYPFFKPTDLNEGYYVKKSGDGLSKKGIEEARLLPSKSILVTCIGATIGKTGLIRVSGAFNQQINAIIPQKNVLPEFVYFVCISPQFQKSIVDNSSATTLPILNKRKFEMLTMPIPPLIEQQKIVSEIEKQFSRLDEAVAALKRVRASLKRYKASVLKAAVEGKLTEEWRKENPNVEPAEKLLKRILAERKKKWEEKNPKKKYKEPPAPDTSTLPDLPKGWVWATVGQISETNPSIDKKSIPDDLLVSFVPMAEVGAENGHINVNNTRPFSEVKKGFTNFLEGDVLFAKITPCMENGKMAIVPALSSGYGFGSTEFHVIRPYDGVNPYFIYYMVSNLSYRKEAAHHMTGAVGQKRVPESFLVNTCMPLPHLEEQLQIISEVQRRLTVIEKLYAEINGNLKRAERLRQAILKKAFSGRLVHQASKSNSKGGVHYAK